MDRPTCQSCRHWQPYGTTTGDRAGDCRRYPPQLVLVELSEFEGSKSSGFNAMNGEAWPSTRADAWCGEHRPAATLAENAAEIRP